jgi:hypothetical protein
MTLEIENINLAFHNIILKHATRMPKCKVVWIFYASTKKGNALNILEQLRIYSDVKEIINLNDIYEDAYSAIYKVILNSMITKQNNNIRFNPQRPQLACSLHGLPSSTASSTSPLRDNTTEQHRA